MFGFKKNSGESSPNGVIASKAAAAILLGASLPACAPYHLGKTDAALTGEYLNLGDRAEYTKVNPKFFGGALPGGYQVIESRSGDGKSVVVQQGSSTELEMYSLKITRSHPAEFWLNKGFRLLESGVEGTGAGLAYGLLSKGTSIVNNVEGGKGGRGGNGGQGGSSVNVNHLEQNQQQQQQTTVNPGTVVQPPKIPDCT